MRGEELAQGISSALDQQVKLALAAKIDGAHIPLFEVPSDFWNEEYCSIWERYNGALFRSLHLYIRYLRQLKAWVEILPTLDKDISDTVTMDYAFPVFRMACDIPTTFKDQLVRGAVKLGHAAKGDYRVIETRPGKKRIDWHKAIKSLAKEDDGLKNLNGLLERDLYKSESAQYFRERHGKFMHDAAPTLVDGLPIAMQAESGIVLFGYEESIDLEGEVEVLERRRWKLQEAYRAFNEFAEKKYETLVST